MKIKKQLLSLLIIPIITFYGTSINIKAKSIDTSNESLPHSNLTYSDSVAQKNFNNLMENIHKKEHGKVISTTDKYVNFKNISSDPNKPVYKPVEYSKQDFLNKANQQNTIVYNPTNNISLDSVASRKVATNSWMRITLEIDDIGSGKRKIYGFYQWLTNPLVTLNDTLSLGHDANTVFDFSSSGSDNYIDYTDSTGNFNTSTRLYSYSDTDHRMTSVAGILYTFPLGGDMIAGDNYAYSGDYQYGLIFVTATRAASSNGNIVFEYAHEEINLSIGAGISFNFDGSLSFGFATHYDPVNVGDTIHF